MSNNNNPQATPQFEMVARYATPNQPNEAIQIVRFHLLQMNARRFATIEESNFEFWTKDNRVFVIQRDGDFFRLFTSIDFDTMDTALDAIDKFFRIPKFDF
jgi:hypothetical protein